MKTETNKEAMSELSDIQFYEVKKYKYRKVFIKGQKPFIRQIKSRIITKKVIQ